MEINNEMQIVIHRGTHQIGGCITEINTEISRIIIDFGANLPGTENTSSKTDEQLVEEVFGQKTCNAVLFSHYHGDHYGMYKKIPWGIPLYIGATAKKILTVLTKRLDTISEEKGLPIIESMHTYGIGQWMDFGDIRVRPLLVDHSALDSYMFLIEAAGKRILFTGDYREHGITGENSRFERMLKEYVGNEIDILITEGTMLSRIHEPHKNKIITEKDLGIKAAEIFSRNENKYCFVLVSSTNLDSIMEFYHAIPNNRAFVCDAYQAEIMKIAMDDKGYYYKEYRSEYLGEIKRPIYLLGDMGEFCNTQGYYKADIKRMKEKGFVMFVRANANPTVEKGRFEKVLDCFVKDDPLIIYSMWEGYLQEKHKDENLIKFIGDYRKEHLHTSGHAYVDTIKKVIEMVNPKTIIPMHTECADEFMNIEEFSNYSGRIKVLNDGEVFDIF